MTTELKLPCSECNKIGSVTADNNHLRAEMMYCRNCESQRARTYGCARILAKGRRCTDENPCGCDGTGKRPGPETEAADGLVEAKRRTEQAQEELQGIPPRKESVHEPTEHEQPFESIWRTANSFGFFMGMPDAFGLTWNQTAHIQQQYAARFRALNNLRFGPSDSNGVRKLFNTTKNEFSALETQLQELRAERERFLKVAHTQKQYHKEVNYWKESKSDARYQALLTQVRCQKCNTSVSIAEMVGGMTLLGQNLSIPEPQEGSWRVTILMVKFYVFLSKLPPSTLKAASESPYGGTDTYLEQLLVEWPSITASDVLRYGARKPLSYSEVWALTQSWMSTQQAYEDDIGDYMPVDPWIAWRYLREPCTGEVPQSARDIAEKLSRASHCVDWCFQCVSAYGPTRTSSRTKSPREPIPARTRFEVFKRDGFRCQFCGRAQADGVKLHVDHIVPVSEGGTNEIENLQTLCEECNLGKGSESLFD